MSISSTFGLTRPTTHPLLVLLSGNGGVALLTLVRNIFAARLIGVEHFGIAASFAIIVSAVEMMTTLGVQQAIVRDKSGETPVFQSTLHSIQLVRGLLGAFAIYIAADPIAIFMTIPEHAWAFRTLALIPLLTGLVHLDAWRYQRRSRFGPSIYIQLGPAALALMMIWPLHVKFGDFKVLLIASIIHAAGVLVMSHLVAERPYLLAFKREYFTRVLRFGMPLAFNGFLLLAVFHGEKLLVAHLQGPQALAILAMGFTLTLTPALIIGRSLQAYALPKLSAVYASPEAFREQSEHVLRICLYIGAALGIALSLLASFIPFLLGPDFAALVTLFPILAALHAVRVVKTGVSIVALAMSDSINTVLGNIPRVMALFAIYPLLVNGGSLTSVLWIATTAELAGLLLALWALQRKLNRSQNA